MKHKTWPKRSWLLILCLSLLLGGAVSAQKSNLSTSDKIKEANKNVALVRRIHTFIGKKLEDARRKNDLPATDCLRDKSISISALRKLTESAAVSLQDNVTKNDGEAINSNYEKINQYVKQAQDLETEAKLCKGKDGVYRGKTKVTISGDTTRGGDDPTLPPWSEPVVIRNTSQSTFY